MAPPTCYTALMRSHAHARAAAAPEPVAAFCVCAAEASGTHNAGLDGVRTGLIESASPVAPTTSIAACLGTAALAYNRRLRVALAKRGALQPRAALRSAVDFTERNAAPVRGLSGQISHLRDCGGGVGLIGTEEGERKSRGQNCGGELHSCLG